MTDIDAVIEAEKAKKVLAVCMPLYDGKVCWETWFQLRQEEWLFAHLGLGWRIDPIIIAGCSAIHIARNDAVAEAFKRGADAIMWIDGDMNWSSGAIAAFIAHDVDFVAAAVPRKETPIHWNVRFLDPDNIEVHPEKGLIEVSTVGTGFMFTRKRVYDLLAERLGPEYRYKGREDGEIKVCYFEAPRSMGEDTQFCTIWRNLVGGKVWVDPKVTMQHVIAPKWSVTACLDEWLAEKRAEQAKAA
jgi:hypothetical protein